MSLTVTVYCREGIVMASDSRATYNYTESVPPQEGRPPLIVNHVGVHHTDTAYKTFLTPQGIGVSVCGGTSVDGQPIAGVIEAFLQQHGDLSVTALTEAIHAHFSALPMREGMEFVIAGYEGDRQVIHRIHTQSPTAETLDTDRAGMLWGGETDVISRLIGEVYLRRVQPDGTETYTLHAGAPILWDHFSLQDGIDFAVYAIQTTVGAMRFQRRIKSVGGPIDVLVIRPTGAEWIARKQLHAPSYE